MKVDLNKPLYADYMKQNVLKFFWSIPVKSREKSYGLADMPLVIIGRILIIIAIGIIGCLNPFARDYYPNNFVTAIICLILIIIAELIYLRIFVYRFGRFRVTWEDEELHPETQASSRCDENGKFLKTEENRKAARKSRFAFLGLFTGIIAVVLMYCFLWIGLSYLRVPSWHKGEIEEAWQIAQKYDQVYVEMYWGIGGTTESGEDLSEQERQRLSEILDSLEWEYVSAFFIYPDSGNIVVRIKTIFGYSYLLWYENADSSQAEHFADTVIQLDEHWFYAKMDDGSRFY